MKLQSRGGQGWFLLGAPGEKVTPCLFLLPDTACIPWLVVPLSLQPHFRRHISDSDPPTFLVQGPS